MRADQKSQGDKTITLQKSRRETGVSDSIELGRHDGTGKRQKEWRERERERESEREGERVRERKSFIRNFAQRGLGDRGAAQSRQA